MTTHKLFQGPTEMYCQNFVQTKVLARGPHTHNDYQSRLRVKGKTAPQRQRYETAGDGFPSREGTLCAVVGLQQPPILASGSEAEDLKKLDDS